MFLRDGFVNANPFFPADDPQESESMQTMQGQRRHLRLPTPIIGGPFATEMRFEVRRMNPLLRGGKLEHALFERAQPLHDPRMQQPPRAPRHESMHMQPVFLEFEPVIVPLEIANPIVSSLAAAESNPAPRWSLDRIGLYETQPLDGLPQRGRMKKRSGDRLLAQIVQHRNRSTTDDTQNTDAINEKIHSY